MDSKRFAWGSFLLLIFSFLLASINALLSDTGLLWHSMAARGVIVNVQTAGCWKLGLGTTTSYSVQFTDQANHDITRTGAISQCDYSGFKASPGESVNIVYLPGNPTLIAPANPSEGLLAKVQFDLILTILFGLIFLIINLFRIREQIPNFKLQRQERQAAAERWRAMGERMTNGVDQE